MKKLKILHAADLHMDSPFEALPGSKAALRRQEQRELLGRMAELVQREGVELVLLAGDLMDSESGFCETGEVLFRSLAQMAVPVFIAPGNHDYYSPRSPYAKKLPENVHVFRENRISRVELPELGVRVYGAGFIGRQSGPLLRGFHAEREEGITNLLCLHGEVGAPESPYDPIAEAELAESGLDYAALGHIHKAGGLRRAGRCFYSWPGCPEGRGFDETGEKYVNLIELDGEACTLQTRSVAGRRYEVLRVDVSGSDPLLAIHALLPGDTQRDIYRLILTGETDTPPELGRLYENLKEFFFALQLRDETSARQDLWARVGEDSLRGLFLGNLRAAYDRADGEMKRRIEQAARWGLAALDNREEPVRHEDQ